MQDEWTIESVKRELPYVNVKLPNGNIVTGRLSGRLNSVATVCVGYSQFKAIQSIDGRGWIDYHFAWKTITHSLNSGNPLIV